MRVGRKDHSEFDDPAFLAMLRQGDQRAYQRLIRRFHGSLVGVAAAIIGSHAQGEEVVQDAWLAVHAGIGRFEGRSSLITWLFSIVLNRARTRATREARTVGLPDLADAGDPGERAVPLSAFQPDGHWADAPRLWDEISPERIVGGRQLWDHVLQAIERLPAAQRAVLILRDIEQCEADEACALLEISAENQRVLLHRARGRIRATIDRLVGAEPVAASRAVPGRRGGRTTDVVGRYVVAMRRLLAWLTRETWRGPYKPVDSGQRMMVNVCL
jgi:RNA polymerase sigma-70 factor (ECF subfamily)